MSRSWANDEAQTPRGGRPNTIVLSDPLRVIGVVCSAWLACLLLLDCYLDRSELHARIYTLETTRANLVNPRLQGL